MSFHTYILSFQHFYYNLGVCKHTLGKEINLLREYFAMCADRLDGIISPDGIWAGREQTDVIYIDAKRLGKAKAIVLEAMAQHTDAALILNNISIKDEKVRLLLDEHISRLAIVTGDILSVCNAEEIWAKQIMQKVDRVIMFQQKAFSAKLFSEYFGGTYEYMREASMLPLDTGEKADFSLHNQTISSPKNISSMDRNTFLYQYKNRHGRYIQKYGTAW